VRIDVSLTGEIKAWRLRQTSAPRAAVVRLVDKSGSAETSIAVNQTSVFLGTKLAAGRMAKAGGGSIVNITSIMGFVGSGSGHPAYSQT